MVWSASRGEPPPPRKAQITVLKRTVLLRLFILLANDSSFTVLVVGGFSSGGGGGVVVQLVGYELFNKVGFTYSYVVLFILGSSVPVLLLRPVQLLYDQRFPH